MKTQELFIDGAWTSTPDHFEVTNPWDGSVIGQAAKCERQHVSTAVGAAVAAVRTPWPAHERAAVLRNAAALLSERAEEFAQSIRAEAGKPITAARAEVGRAIDTVQFSAEAARGLTGITVPLDAVKSGVGLLGFEELSPRGVVAAITPFNFPLNLVLHKVGPALAAGCPVVLKPSEKTPLVAGLLAQVLQEAGAVRGAFNLVTGDPELIVASLLEDERVAVVTFTGSAQLGWSLKARSPKKHHILELGSNTAMVVAGDADIGRAVDAAVAASFTFAGQACISLQRVYVHQSVAEEFVEKLVKAAVALPAGDPEDERVVVGPMITRQARDRVLAWVASALDAGATLRSGGRLHEAVLLPTVLTDVPPTSPVICDEVFGPVVSVNTVRDVSEGIEHLNNSRFGLNASIFTSDISSALDFARRAESGSVLINVPPSFRADHMPYGGVKESGQGREGVPYAVRDLLERKLVVIAP